MIKQNETLNVTFYNDEVWGLSFNELRTGFQNRIMFIILA